MKFVIYRGRKPSTRYTDVLGRTHRLERNVPLGVPDFDSLPTDIEDWKPRDMLENVGRPLLFRFGRTGTEIVCALGAMAKIASAHPTRAIRYVGASAFTDLIQRHVPRATPLALGEISKINFAHSYDLFIRVGTPEWLIISNGHSMERAVAKKLKYGWMYDRLRTACPWNEPRPGTELGLISGSGTVWPELEEAIIQAGARPLHNLAARPEQLKNIKLVVGIGPHNTQALIAAHLGKDVFTFQNEKDLSYQQLAAFKGLQNIYHAYVKKSPATEKADPSKVQTIVRELFKLAGVMPRKKHEPPAEDPEVAEILDKPNRLSKREQKRLAAEGDGDQRRIAEADPDADYSNE